MRIGTQSAALHFLPVTLQLRRLQTPFKKGPRVHPGGRVRLEVNQITAPGFAVRTEKVIEADLENFRRRGVTGDVTAQFAIGLVRLRHHGQGVPANDRGDALLHHQIPGINRLLFERDGVLVQRIRTRRRLHAETAGLLGQSQQQEPHARSAADFRDTCQGFQPLVGFNGIDVFVNRRSVGWPLRGIFHGRTP
ncbi:hypothetical protein D3C87_1102710 [compost metagenome]